MSFHMTIIVIPTKYKASSQRDFFWVVTFLPNFFVGVGLEGSGRCSNSLFPNLAMMHNDNIVGALNC